MRTPLLLLATALFTACEANTYDPQEWPRALLVEDPGTDDAAQRRVAYVRLAVDVIHASVGAAVWNLAITAPLENIPCDTVYLRFAPVRPDHELGTASVTPERCYAEVVIAAGAVPGVDEGDERTVIHQLFHVLGIGHDEIRNSVMYPDWGCLAGQDHTPSYCRGVLHSQLTFRHVNHIRQMMGLAPLVD